MPGFDEEFSKLYAHIVAGDLPAHLKLTEKVLGMGLSPGAVVLSLGDGTGEPGVRIAKELPSAKVISTDASETMTAMAAKYGTGLDNLTTLTVSADDGDLAAKCGLEEDSVDVVVLSFSLMFVPDKEKCLASVKALLKPGGHIIIAVLSKFGMMTCFGAGMNAVLGQTPSPSPSPPGPTSPLSLSDPKILDTLVSEAGFVTTISDESMRYPFPLGPTLEVTRPLSQALVKEPLTKMKAEGKEDAFEVFVEAFMGACEANGWIKDNQCILPEDECVVRVLVARPQ